MLDVCCPLQVKLCFQKEGKHKNRCFLPLACFPSHIQEAATRAYSNKGCSQDGEDSFWIDFKADWSLVLRITGMLHRSIRLINVYWTRKVTLCLAL
jgi:hypothetical protein